ncbi:MAG TPA: DUF4342 domain-containing protein [Trueperaceae bacterium]
MSDNTHETNHQPEGQGPKGGFQEFLNQLVRGVRQLIAEGNRRHLVVRSQRGSTVLRLPLTAAVLIVLVVAWLQLLPILVIAVVVALVMRMQFSLTKEAP